MNRSVAAIVMREGAVLLAQRKPGGAIGDRWEFPGGKAHAAEDLPTALTREIVEELGVSCSIGRLLAEATFENCGEQYRLHAYAVNLDTTDFTLREHTRVRWVPWPEVSTYDLPDSDRLLLAPLAAHVAPRGTIRPPV